MTTARRPLVALHTVINDRYEIVELLGMGGMGWVARALDRKLDNTEIVLKFLHSHLIEDEELFMRFKNEVLLMRELTHPNIIRTYDFSEESSRGHFITMEFVRGKSLAQLLQADPRQLPFHELMDILHQIASGMAFAHSKGVIHRDLKPENILIDGLGVAKVADFGLARTLVREHNITQTGNTVGTPYYMSPEQLKGESVDPRSDIYSFGILSYEACSGEKPFHSDNYLELAELHLISPLPKVLEKAPKTPLWFQGFLEQCTAKNSSKRFQTFNEIVEVIAPFVDSNGAKSDSLRSPGSKIQFEKWISRFYWTKLFAFLRSGLFFTLFSLFGIALLMLISENNHWFREYWVPWLYRLETTAGIPTSYFAHLTLFNHLEKKQYPDEFFVRPNADSLRMALEQQDSHVAYLILASGLDPEKAAKSAEPILLEILGNTIENQKQILLTTPLLEVLISHGAEYDWQDKEGQTSLMYAVHQGSRSMLATILHHVKEVDPEGFRSFVQRQDKKGKTALVHSIERARIPLIGTLLNYKIRQEADNTGMTPLMYAIKTSNPKIVRLVLSQEEGQATINHRTELGKSALHFALETGNDEAVDLLFRFGAATDAIDIESKKNTLMYAVESSKLSLVKKVLDHDQNPAASLRRKNKDGKTAKQLVKDKQIFNYLLQAEQKHMR